MPEISISTETAGQISLLARAWEVAPGAVVDRLLANFRDAARPTPGRPRKVAIHAVYGGTRIAAEFDWSTRGVAIQDGPLAGKHFATPSGAAVAVVRSLNPAIRPERNGWNFWIVTETDATLGSIRGRSLPGVA